MFSTIVMDNFLNAHKAGILDPASGFGQAGSREAGRFAQFTVIVEDATIVAARFRTYGCVPAIAACNCLADWVEGLKVEQARSITPEQLVQRLGGLPPQRVFCTVLALEALRNALNAAVLLEATPC